MDNDWQELINVQFMFAASVIVGILLLVRIIFQGRVAQQILY